MDPKIRYYYKDTKIRYSDFRKLLNPEPYRSLIGALKGTLIKILSKVPPHFSETPEIKVPTEPRRPKALKP